MVGREIDDGPASEGLDGSGAGGVRPESCGVGVAEDMLSCYMMMRNCRRVM